MTIQVRRRVVPIVGRPAAAPAPAASTKAPTTAVIRGPVRKVSAAPGGRDELRKKLAELIVPSDPNEPSPESAAYVIKKYRDKVRNPLTAIRAKCIECCNGSPGLVKECHLTKCALHAFRMGHNPFHSKAIAAAQRREGEAHGEDGGEEEADE